MHIFHNSTVRVMNSKYLVNGIMAGGQIFYSVFEEVWSSIVTPGIIHCTGDSEIHKH